MKTRILSGEKVAHEIKTTISQELQELAKKDLVPGLATVLVGDNPSSRVYVGNKVKTCQQLGIRSEMLELPGKTSTQQLLEVIDQLNQANNIDGILIQLPLPDQIDKETVLSAVHPDKDVDGFHPENVGKLCTGKVGLAPCTPLGIMHLLQREDIPIEGAEAVIVGRSNIVGKPIALLLLHQNATVTLCHSRTVNLAQVCRRADILVVAVGKAGLVTREYIKEGSTIIDVGTNRIDSIEEGLKLFGEDSPRLDRIKEKGFTLVGDVHPRDPIGIAAAVTPVPGGVGPLTIAQLMRNTVKACRMRHRGSS